MIIMKFGGTSVANFEAITRTIFIIGGRLDQNVEVGSSTLPGTTKDAIAIRGISSAG